MQSENVQVQVLRYAGHGLINDVPRYRAGWVLTGRLRKLDVKEGKKAGATWEFCYDEPTDPEREQGDRFGHRPDRLEQGDLMKWPAARWHEVARVTQTLFSGRRSMSTHVLLHVVRKPGFVPQVVTA